MLATLRALAHKAVYASIPSPVGPLWLIASEEGLHALLWERDMKTADLRNLLKGMEESPTHPVLKKTVQQLNEYFAGKRQEFDLPLAPAGTEFQKKAWLQLRKIPYGKTISYAEQARQLGDPKKARAVGTANSRNPISIIVPCHRVIASSGGLGGFGGGLPAKEFLLRLEQAIN